MPTVRKAQIPPPESENDFEDLCLEIAKELWQDPEAYKIGTRGQEQSGVDVCAANAMGKGLVYGIQAKKKKALTNQKLTKTDINGTLEGAEKFEPKLDKIVIAATSSRDANLQPFIVEKKHERSKKGKFPFEVWFWEDVEYILREKCQESYINYLTSILPQSSIETLSKDIIEEALVVAEELVKNNYAEKAEGVLSAFDGVIKRSTDPEIKLLAKRIKILTLLRNERKGEATELINELTEKYPEDIDTLAMLNDRYLENEEFDESEKVVRKIKGINSEHPLAKITDLFLKLHTDQDIEILDEEPPGRNNREKSITFFVYYWHAHKKGNKELRDKYIRKHKDLMPNSSNPICNKIIFSVLDLIKDIENLTLEKIENTMKFISEQEAEIEKKIPLSLSGEINIILEKLCLHVLLKRYKPQHQIPQELRRSLITKLCQSYFDAHNAWKLKKILSLILLDKEELDTIFEYLKSAKKPLSRETAFLLIAQASLNDETLRYAETISNELTLDEQKDFIESIKKQDKKTVLNTLKGLDGQCLYFVISSIPNPTFALSLINEVLQNNADDKTRASLMEMKMFLTLEQGGDEAVKKIIKDINLKKEGFNLSRRISQFSSSLDLWDKEVEALKRSLEFTISDELRVQIEGQLCTALFKMEDFTGVLEHTAYVLKHFDKLSEYNQKVVLGVLIRSFLKLYNANGALEVITKFFPAFSADFEFAYLKADAEISLNDYDGALYTILEGLRIQPNITREMFQASYPFFIEISNANLIKNEDEKVVGDGSYVKISDISTWFYIGDKKPIDATKLEISDDRYTALFGQNIGQEIEWPPDKFKSPVQKRKIESIFTEPAYVSMRASEIMGLLAEEGEPYIHAVNLDPDNFLENITKFLQEIEKPTNAFFEIYKNNPIPFAFLAHNEGGIGVARAKMVTLQEGFIHINSGTEGIYTEQQQLALNVVSGSPAFIDATSLLFLIEADLIEVICESIAKLHYTPSVVNYIREHASQFAKSPNVIGRIGLGKDFEVIPSPYNYQKELRIKNRLLKAVEIFEKYANKETENFLSAKEEELEKKLPPYITDPYAAARIRNFPIISEDYNYSHTIKLLTKEEQAKPISSLALVEALYQNGKIKWDKYLNYIDLQLSNRCRLVPISVMLMFRSIFGDNKSGLLIFQPKNIRKLHLGLSLSVQYGVSPKLVLIIMSEFLDMIIKDDTITPEMFKALLSEFLVQGLKGRDKDFKNRLLLECKRKIQNQGLIIPPPNRDIKFKILESQIKTYFSGYHPLCLEVF